MRRLGSTWIDAGFYGNAPGARKSRMDKQQGLSLIQPAILASG
jgi:hypothetical protein